MPSLNLILTCRLRSLWGGANHLKAIEDLIKLNVVDSAEVIHTLRPRTSALFKTYDGIEIIGHRMLLEVLEEINRLLEEEDAKVTKISFVGYSLGGLVSRYIIGELEKLQLFDMIEPVYYATFASPHLGVKFYKSHLKPINFLLANVLGRVGSELAIRDNDQMLVKLTEDEYITGLARFKHRFLFANIRHDRTVNFHTSYITDRNPFNDHWDTLDLNFNFTPSIVSTYRIRGMTIAPKLVNFTDSTFQSSQYVKRPVSIYKRLRYAGIVILLACIVPLWIPIVFTASTIGSIVSSFIVKTYKKQTYEELRKLITYDQLPGNAITATESGSSAISKRRDSSGSSIRERLDEATSEAFENVINVTQYDAHTDSAKDHGAGRYTNQFSVVGDCTPNLVDHVHEIFLNPKDDDFEIFQKTERLPLDETRQLVMQRLNALDWKKFAVYVNVLNAHDGIVARKGLKRSTVKGIALIGFWAGMINEYEKREKREALSFTRPGLAVSS